MVHLLLDLNRPQEAFSYTERSRARGFLDLLANRQLRVGGAGDQSLLDRVRQSKREMVRLSEAARRAEGEAVSEAERELEEARAAYRKLLEELRSQNPDLTDFVEVRPVDAARIRARLTGDVALVGYYVTAEDTLAFVVRSGRISAHKLALPRSDLSGMVARVRRLLQNFTPAEEELKRLYDGLVAPLAGDLAGVSSVGVLPHDVLNYLPFAALKAADGAYWSDKVFLFVSPSASVLALLLRREEERFGPAGGLLAVGNPDLGDAPGAYVASESSVVGLMFIAVRLTSP